MFNRRAFLDVRAMAQLAWMTEYASCNIGVGFPSTHSTPCVIITEAISYPPM
jgi:hypothetical protein